MDKIHSTPTEEQSGTTSLVDEFIDHLRSDKGSGSIPRDPGTDPFLKDMLDSGVLVIRDAFKPHEDVAKFLSNPSPAEQITKRLDGLSDLRNDFNPQERETIHELHKSIATGQLKDFQKVVDATLVRSDIRMSKVIIDHRACS